MIPRHQGLCGSCAVTVAKYWEENPHVFDPYVAAGIADIEASLEHHAGFEAWLINHPGRKP